MTVTYTDQVAKATVGGFLKLLFRWRGSMYRLMWKEFIIFALLFTVINCIYRFALTAVLQRHFEFLCRYINQHNSFIPVTFVLGFYVSMVFSKWRDQFNSIPWPDRLAMFVAANLQGSDDRSRLMRRTIMRYVSVAYVMCLSSISSLVRKRFPTISHLTDAGLLLSGEQQIIDNLKYPYHKFFVPLVWSTSLVTRAHRERKIKDYIGVNTIIDEINNFRGMLGTLFDHDRITIPLVYTQVVTLVLYGFFASLLLGGQITFTGAPDGGRGIDMYIPWWTFLQFIAFMGWLKVGETMINPFGEDDDDFDVNWIIDRNLQASYLVVDGMHEEHPDLIKDAYWDQEDFNLPHTEASLPYSRPPHLGSAIHLNFTPKDSEFVFPTLHEEPEEDEDENYQATSQPIPMYNSKIMHKTTSNDSKLNGIYGHMKRSFSKGSRKTSAETTPSMVRHGAGAEGGESMQTVTTGGQQEEMFLMDDISNTAVLDASDIGSGDEAEKSRTVVRVPTKNRSRSNTQQSTDTRTSLDLHDQADAQSTASNKRRSIDSRTLLSTQSSDSCIPLSTQSSAAAADGVVPSTSFTHA